MDNSIIDHVRAHRTDAGFAPRKLPVPTNAIPGTAEKLAVLQARIEAGEQLHHPDDRHAEPPLFPSVVAAPRMAVCRDLLESVDQIHMYCLAD